MLNVDSYTQRREEFKERDINLVFIGIGGIKKAKEYAKTFNMGERTLFLDQKRVSHGILELNVGTMFQLLSDSTGRKLSSEASKKGFKIAAFGTGSYTQYGGVALISPEKGIMYLHKCQASYDLPDVDELLKECDKHASSAARNEGESKGEKDDKKKNKKTVKKQNQDNVEEENVEENE